MSKRTYNILFHLHTVSGIVISVALYVIFFTGSFAFFRDEIVNWERGHTVKAPDEITVDLDETVNNLSKEQSLFGRDIELRHYYNEQRIGVNLGASKDTLLSKDLAAGSFYYLDTKDNTTTDYASSYTLGEFLYRLHFFAQLPHPYGYYLSGFVAFFFLFAIFTGILVHWDKIIKNFYVFRPRAKLKTLWTDAHTALGVIGFPFQFVYAVTGAFFMLKLLLVAPSVLALYDGDDKKLYEDLEYSHPEFAFDNTPLPTPVSINDYVDRVKKKWKDFKVTEVHIFNYGDTNMHVSVSGNLDYKDKLNGYGYTIFKVADQSVHSVKDPTLKTSYLDVVKGIFFRLHFGDYGGYGLRIISFIMGLIGCFVILSGVLIWLTARDKKNIPLKKRKFNEGVVRYYLAICLSMYPITALSFIMVQVVNPAGMSMLYKFFFIGWLLISILFILKKDNYFTNKYSLLSGSILGLAIPIVNGIYTGNWLWVSYSKRLEQILFIDVFWILLALTGFWVLYKMNKQQKPTVQTAKNQ
ncbi:PepSY domain-containing protein [Maribacter sp. MMG018]|uniref:PepSY-associated TM helix domain-containing protein n=1 Tax=Maribacter sp. MMG018 TaxID=2822688 RepID=UPI001B397EC1|nr:PepSY-associated TM helix domain-containing protein [Maribacter sp. MMG018]MBQ4914218.1 PepSY domain-containing protein [Maribacter sp. MMG018]